MKPLKNIKDARLLLSRLISGFQTGLISSADAKALTYMLVSYLSITRDNGIEDRLEKLEAHVQEQHAEEIRCMLNRKNLEIARRLHYENGYKPFPESWTKKFIGESREKAKWWRLQIQKEVKKLV